MKRSYDRTQRIADLIQQTLAELLYQTMADERFRLVTVTGTTVAKDLSFAKIYVSVMSQDAEEIGAIIQALNRASSAFRYHLAHTIKLRVMPQLKFLFDESTAQGFHLSELIHKAMNTTENKN